MNRPQRLWQTIQFDLFIDLLSRMTFCETAVIGRMPILRGDHQRELRLKLIRDRNDLISLRHGERAAREKVVLNIYQDQCFHKVLASSDLNCLSRLQPLNWNSFAT